jgi:hypothetical protein
VLPIEALPIEALPVEGAAAYRTDATKKWRTFDDSSMTPFDGNGVDAVADDGVPESIVFRKG